MEQNKKKKSSKTAVWVTIIIFVLLIGGCAACLGGSDSDSSESESTSTASASSTTDYTKFSEDYRAEYDVVARNIITHYCNCELPDYTDKSEWTYTDFDDQDDGKVLVSTTASVEGVADTQTVYLVFSMDGEKYSGYYLCVGDKLYIDDGSCSETMKKLGLPTNE